MPNFCKKCGSQLYDSNDCPVCGTQQTSPIAEPVAIPQSAPVSIHPKTEAQKKVLKKKIIRAKNKARKNVDKTLKLNYMSKFQKTTRIVVNCVSLMLVCVIALSLIVGTLAYFDKINVPVVNNALESIGITRKTDCEPKNEKTNDKKPEPEVTDGESALKKARTLAKDHGYTTAVDELILVNKYTENSVTYYELQQYHNEIPVYKKTVVLCVDKDGQVIKETVELADIDITDTNPELYYDYAQVCIRDDLMYNQPDFIYSIDIADVNIEEYSPNQLVYYLDNDSVAHLAYKLNITASGIPYIYVIDAYTGVIHHSELIVQDTDEEPTSDPDSATLTEPSTPTEATPVKDHKDEDSKSTPTSVKPSEEDDNNKPDFTFILLIIGGVLILIAVVFIILKSKKKGSSASKYPKTF